MKIEKDTVVSLRYKVAERNGKLIEESREPMVYLHGGYDNTLPKIEAALDGKEPGYEVTLQLKPEDAFGVRDESLVRTIPKKDFPPGVKVGGQLEGVTDDGQPHVFHVMKIKGDTGAPGRQPSAGGQGPDVLAEGDRACARPRPRRSRIATCMARTGITTECSDRCVTVRLAGGTFRVTPSRPHLQLDHMKSEDP